MEFNLYLRIIFLYIIPRKPLEEASKNFSVFVPNERRTKRRKRMQLMHPCIVWALPLLQLFSALFVRKVLLVFTIYDLPRNASDAGPMLISKMVSGWFGLGPFSVSSLYALMALLFAFRECPQCTETDFSLVELQASCWAAFIFTAIVFIVNLSSPILNLSILKTY